MSSLLDDSGLIVGDAYQLEYSRRRGSWMLRHPTDLRRAWSDASLLGLAEKVIGEALDYRYDIKGHDSSQLQLRSRSFEGVLLACAGHPTLFNVPPELEGDYSERELQFLRKWQEILLAGTASTEEPPIDAQSLSFKEALEIISASPESARRR